MERRDQRAGGSYPRNTQLNQMSSDAERECMVKEQDRYMPIANVIRLMRRIMPGHAKISDDAKETIQECVSEFISFITSEANMRCHQEHRKTITAEDVLWAMNNLGFDDYIEPLTFYLNRMREIESGERGPFRGDPLLRRSIEAGAMGVAPAFTPTYYMVPRSGIPGFMTMAQNAGSSTSGAGVNSLDRCSQWKQ